MPTIAYIFKACRSIGENCVLTQAFPFYHDSEASQRCLPLANGLAYFTKLTKGLYYKTF
jgi:hypothetical protein